MHCGLAQPGPLHACELRGPPEIYINPRRLAGVGLASLAQ